MITKIDASELILENTSEYTRHIVDNQFPSPIDGLKKVQRRAIWANRKNKGSVSGAYAIAEAFKIHPYGDQSIYNATVRMSQPFKMTYPLLTLIGDCGTYSGDDHAAMRYVEYEISEFTKDLFLDGIAEKTFKLVQDEHLESTEPAYFIPKLPTSLLIGSKTVGIGTNSIIIPYRLDKICNGVMEYSNFADKNGMLAPWPNVLAGKHFVPYFPVDGYVRNIPQLLDYHNQGIYDHRIVMDGILELGTNTILIKTLPIDTEVDKAKNKIWETMRTKNSWLDKNLVKFDLLSNTKMDADLLLTFKKSVDIFEALQVVKRLASFTGYVTPAGNYTIDKYLISLTPPQVLQTWYRERYNSILGKKKYTQMRLAKELTRVNIGLLVSGRVKEVTNIIHDNDIEIGKKLLQKTFTLTEAQSILLYGMPLSTIARTSKEELLSLKEKLTKENDEIRDSYKSIHSEIYNDAEFYKKKYSKILRKPNSMIGYLVVNNKNIVQFDSISDLHEVMTTFNKIITDVVLYGSKDDLRLYEPYPQLAQYGVTPDSLLPKICLGEGLIYDNAKLKCTVIIKEGKVCQIQEYVPKQDLASTSYIYTNKQMCIDNTGNIKDIDLDTIAVRRKGGSGNMTDLIYIGDKDVKYPKYVISCNSSSPNHIRIERIEANTDKIVVTSAGITRIIAVINNNVDEYVVNIPSDCINNMRIKFVYLTHINIPEGRSYITFNVNTSKNVKRDKEAMLATVNVSSLN